MRRPRSSRGMTLIELIVAMAIFSIFLVILGLITTEFRRFERDLRLRWFAHPEDLSVLVRLRRDVSDSRGYPVSKGSFTQSPQTLLLDLGAATTAVWEFGDGTVRRTEWKGESIQLEWSARATPTYEISSWTLPDGETAVRLTGRDAKGRIGVDQTFRPHAK